jgi:hypothetical protein
MESDAVLLARRKWLLAVLLSAAYSSGVEGMQ